MNAREWLAEDAAAADAARSAGHVVVVGGDNSLTRPVLQGEVDANADVNCSTVRLMAATFLAFCSGLASRPRTRLAE